MSIAGNLTQVKQSLPAEVTLVAVSKFHPVSTLQEAYDAGQRVFGESRAQEIKAKQPQLPSDIEWHFIGTLQTNKVKDIAPFIHTIHSVDSLKLIEEINKQAKKHNRIIRVLLEIHIAEEESKHGLTRDTCLELLQQLTPQNSSHVHVAGLMGMATFTEDCEQIRKEFKALHTLFSELKTTQFVTKEQFNTLSMGMSDDYPVAVEEGSTMVRVGSAIFGNRAY